MVPAALACRDTSAYNGARGIVLPQAKQGRSPLSILAWRHSLAAWPLRPQLMQLMPARHRGGTSRLYGAKRGLSGAPWPRPPRARWKRQAAPRPAGVNPRARINARISICAAGSSLTMSRWQSSASSTALLSGVSPSYRSRWAASSTTCAGLVLLRAAEMPCMTFTHFKAKNKS